MSEAENFDDGDVIVCAGPPTCPLEGDEAVQNAVDGCTNCERHVLQPDGSWKIFKKAAN